MKITLAFDSFKGSLSSAEVAAAFAEGFCSRVEDCDVCIVPVSDGGEGLTQAIVAALGGEMINVDVADPLNRTITACYGVVDNGHTAVIEVAAASGITLLCKEEYNPMLTTTRGFGMMIVDALNRGCRKFLIGLGGSATNDGGMGMLRALGYRLLTVDSSELSGVGGELGQVYKIDGEHIHPALLQSEFIVACDVDNPLYGSSGAAYVFAPQKGADASMVEYLDCGLHNWAKVLCAYSGVDVSSVAGAGAAGGLGAAMVAMFNTRLVRGIDMVLDTIKFDDLIAGSDFVFTGEGCIDEQTMMGKAPMGVLQRAMSQDIPTIAVAGMVKCCVALEQSAFYSIISVTNNNIPLSEAMQPYVARSNVRLAATHIAEQLVDVKQKENL